MEIQLPRHCRMLPRHCRMLPRHCRMLPRHCRMLLRRLTLLSFAGTTAAVWGVWGGGGIDLWDSTTRDQTEMEKGSRA